MYLIFTSAPTKYSHFYTKGQVVTMFMGAQALQKYTS